MSASSIPIEAIFAKGQEFAATCQYDLAGKFLRRVLQMNPEYTPALDELAMVLVEEGDNEAAQELLERSISLRPDGDPEVGDDGFLKYLTIAHLVEGQQAVQYYERAVPLLRKAAERSDDKNERESLKKRAAEAFASMAELYLTDLCFEEDAEACCQRHFERALELDPECVEALQTAASCRISQHRKSDALTYLQRSYDIWASLDPTDAEFPSYATRVATSKLFIELDKPQTAIEILDQLLLEDDQITEVWYLLILSHELTSDLDSCAEAVANALHHVNTCQEIHEDDRKAWLKTFNEYATKLNDAGISLPEVSESNTLADD